MDGAAVSKKNLADPFSVSPRLRWSEAKSDAEIRCHPTDAIVELRRKGSDKVTFLRVPGEHLDRLLALADRDHNESLKVIDAA
jgi:hypothetical protein